LFARAEQEARLLQLLEKNMVLQKKKHAEGVAVLEEARATLAAEQMHAAADSLQN
jgi:hypothetical protein